MPSSPALTVGVLAAQKRAARRCRGRRDPARRLYDRARIITASSVTGPPGLPVGPAPPPPGRGLAQKNAKNFFAIGLGAGPVRARGRSVTERRGAGRPAGRLAYGSTTELANVVVIEHVFASATEPCNTLVIEHVFSGHAFGSLSEVASRLQLGVSFASANLQEKTLDVQNQCCMMQSDNQTLHANVISLQCMLRTLPQAI